MSRCKHCKRPIKWLQVPVEGFAGTELQWRVFDKKRTPSGPYAPHICKKEDLPKPDPKFSRIPPKPWWADND